MGLSEICTKMGQRCDQGNETDETALAAFKGSDKGQGSEGLARPKM